VASHFYSEVTAIARKWPIWLMLGTQDIKLRYRRSALGPLWITISMAVTVCSMGFLYGHLFKVDLNHYFPYLTAGIISWSFISTLLSESSNTFIESERYIRNQESFLSLFLLRLILRNSLVFLHNLLVLVPVLFIFHMGVGFNTLLVIPGLIIIALNALFWGTLLAVLGTRYRDFSQIVNSVIQVVFFITPVMWTPNLLPENMQWMVQYNPFNHFLNFLRMPLLNQAPSLYSIAIGLGITVAGSLLYAAILSRYKHRVVFWL
jgi:ABC-type polysaccharide/polyol phosphate export permease